MRQKHLLPVALLIGMTAPAAGDDQPTIIFNMKNFTDTGDMVHVEGTLTGDGIGYKNNRSALTCYHDTEECISTHIDVQGNQVFSIGPPVTFTVRLWTEDRIVADFAVFCGTKPKSGFPDDPLLKEKWNSNASDTWIIDRTRQTAELSDHPCLGAKTYHWTIEDPPFWRKNKSQ